MVALVPSGYVERTLLSLVYGIGLDVEHDCLKISLDKSLFNDDGKEKNRQYYSNFLVATSKVSGARLSRAERSGERSVP